MTFPQHTSPQMSGELLAQIKQLAKDHYLQLQIGTEADFQNLWQQAFILDSDAERTLPKSTRAPKSTS